MSSQKRKTGFVTVPLSNGNLNDTTLNDLSSLHKRDRQILAFTCNNPEGFSLHTARP